MSWEFVQQNPLKFKEYTTSARDALGDAPDRVVIYNTTVDRIQIFDGDQWQDVVSLVGTPSSTLNMIAWNNTEKYFEPVTRKHGTSQHTEFANWKLIYTDGSGDQQEIALGADGTVLTGTGTGAAPVFEAASGHAHANDHAAVTVSGSPDYITLTGQDIVRGLIVLTTDVSGVLPEANLPNATESAEGVVEEATAAEAVTGTADRVMALGVAAAQIQKGSWLYGTDAGGDDAYTVLFTPTIAALTTGMVVCFEPSFTNVGAATLQIEGLVAKTIKKHHDQDLANGDIEAGQIVTVVYDGTVFQMQSQLGNASGGGSYTDAEAIAAVEGEATLDLAGILDITKYVTGSKNSFTWSAQEDNHELGDVGALRILLSGGDQTLRGIKGGTDGRVLWIYNRDVTETLTIAHNAAGSAAWRVTCENNVDAKIRPNGVAILIYDGTSIRWRCLAGSPVAGAGGVAGDAIWDAKGDLAGGTGGDAAVRLAVGANGQSLVAASGEATGLKWISPKRSIMLMAAGGKPTTSDGCAGPTQVEAVTNDVNYWVLDFDKDSDEFAYWNVIMPDNYDGGTITATPYWTAASGSGTVAFTIAARAYADSAAIDQAWTDLGETSTDTLITAEDVHIGLPTSAITMNGSPVGGDYVVFRVMRDVSADSLGVDARLLGIKISYGTDNASDE